jgi:hypothetical protein
MARLTEMGEARQNSGFRTEGSTVYQVDDIDPRLVLVMKLIPGEHDDAGSIGAYLVLVRGDGFSLLCSQSGRLVPQPFPGGLSGILGCLMTARDDEGEAKEVTIESGDELREGSLIVLSDGRQQRRRLSPKHLGSPVHIP